MALRVLGLDPGLGTTGYAVIEAVPTPDAARLIEAGAIRPGASGPLENRLTKLFETITEIIDEFHVSAVAIEDLYSHYKHPTTAIKMGHARGVMMLAAGLKGLRVYAYGATRIKKHLTGAGHASKAQMQTMVQQKLGLAAPPQPADVADAIAAALCHIHVIRRKSREFEKATENI